MIKIGRKLSFIEYCAKKKSRAMLVYISLINSRKVRVTSPRRMNVVIMDSDKVGFVSDHGKVTFVKINHTGCATTIDGEEFMSGLGDDDLEILFYLDILSAKK